MQTSYGRIKSVEENKIDDNLQFYKTKIMREKKCNIVPSIEIEFIDSL